MNNKHCHQLRVRYGETDQMAFVYYGNYALYLEEARTALIRDLDYSYQKMEDEGILMPVVNLNIDYKRAARYDELLNLETQIEGEVTRKISFVTEIFNQDKRLICKAKVTLVFMDKNTFKVRSCPADLKELLKTYQCR